MQLSTFTVSATALAAAGLALAQSAFTVNTPTTLIQCQPAQLSWTGGQAPYYPRITKGGSPADTLKTFSTTSETSLTWNVDIPANTAVTFAVSDSTGASNASAQVTISQGSSSW